MSSETCPTVLQTRSRRCRSHCRQRTGANRPFPYTPRPQRTPCRMSAERPCPASRSRAPRSALDFDPRCRSLRQCARTPGATSESDDSAGLECRVIQHPSQSRIHRASRRSIEGKHRCFRPTAASGNLSLPCASPGQVHPETDAAARRWSAWPGCDRGPHRITPHSKPAVARTRDS